MPPVFRFPQMPRPPHPLLAALRDIRDTVQHLHKHIHALMEEIVSSKQEVLDALAGVKATLVETGKDVTRVIGKLDEAIANGNLDDIAAAVNELRPLAQSIDDAAEAAVPEPTAEPTEPAPSPEA